MRMREDVNKLDVQNGQLVIQEFWLSLLNWYQRSEINLAVYNTVITVGGLVRW